MSARQSAAEEQNMATECAVVGSIPDRWSVAVVTDDAGSYQARCTHCDWRSVWYERPKYSPESYRTALAIAAAKEHGASHVS